MKSWLVPRRKSFVEPPFWSLDASRFPLFSGVERTRERIGNDFEGYVEGGYKTNGVIYACITRRAQVFSQATFKWQPDLGGDLFGTSELRLLEKPWPNGSTRDLLYRMEVDASLAGAFFATTVDKAGKIGAASAGSSTRMIARMRPDWTTIVIDAPSENPFNLDARIVGYLYNPRLSGDMTATEILLLPNEVCHYVPTYDPVARFRGMSWLTPVIQEVMADKATTRHKLKFFEQGATPSLVVTGIKAATPEQFSRIVDMMEAKHAGSANAFKSMYLVEGADAKTIGADLRQVEFKLTQGAGETRLAVASGVPAGILGISEGLAGSTLNEGNFGAQRRLFVDTTIRDLWAAATSSLQVLVTEPRPGVHLVTDDHAIPFLREDGKDDAEIRGMEASALQQGLAAGFNANAVVEWLLHGDLSKLRNEHSGLQSVQLQPPLDPNATLSPPVPTLGESNGSTNGQPQSTSAR